MDFRKNRILTIFICAVTAIALVVGFALNSRANLLKADEEEPEAPVVTEEADFVAPEVVGEAPAPAEEPAPEIFEAEAAEVPAEEPAEENEGTEVTQEIVIELPAEEEAEAAEEAAEEPEAEDAVEEPEEEPAEEEQEIDFSKLKVEIKSDRKSVMTPGEEVHMEGILTGFEGIEYSLRWQCNKNDGEGFKDIEGANTLYYSFPVSAESLSWSWRLTVDF